MSKSNSNNISSIRSRPSLREFEILRSVVSTGKTTAAAAKLGISQPAVSRALKHLEERLGKTLFLRESGRLVPTSDALALDQRLAPIFGMLAEIENEPWLTDSDRPLRICAPPTLSHRLLQPIIADFIKANRGLRVQMEIGTSADVNNSVAEGIADVGICDGSHKHAGLIREPLRIAEGHIVMHVDDPLSKQDVIRPEHLDGRDFIALTRRFPMRTIFERILLEHGARPLVTVEVSTSVAVAELVLAGAGIGVINPFPIALSKPKSLVFRRFVPVIHYETAFVLSSTNPPVPAARRFIEFTRTYEFDDEHSRPA